MGAKLAAKRRIPKAETSRRMSRIRSSNTKIERVLRAALTTEGLRYRKNYRKAHGSPDIAFISPKVAVFCDSSFWHGRHWAKLKKRLRTNKKFWVDKIAANMRRDRKVNRQLRKEGWIVLRFWEEDILKKTSWCLRKITDALAKRE